ncbi:MAG: Asp23/Gls24 family envelope stress response protein [Lachnospiraceae bacterium]|nr:Asp23/Gls24 family envelope stress response protein [Lachnospiraceae bacterium]
MEKETERDITTLNEDTKEGAVSIADDVVAMIAALASAEVEGVGSKADNITNELMSRVGMKKQAKGVKVVVTEDKVNVDLSITIDYGYNIPETCQNVQKKVKNAIENMTGLEVEVVNIRISGINMKD